ncbi:hypothetical protein CAPTEDRAFT_203048 [Capitella teleta]|uniref:Uncharacterized protein n=1 Tax=Capitella teleta TaxID=283909 RepID=R7TZQ3_CAPTE|nr:hypothetical protein CAPTEDRAFT_203048 [Capitella teleta]|eukprot:ELT96410.1 hypothetical protein CAPTEDRAFT_203048 [Capitella teleta]
MQPEPTDTTPCLDEWLTSLLGDDAHAFENNADTIECLQRLMRANKQRDACTKIYAEDLKQKTLEYALEAKRLKDLLSALGVDPLSLSQSGAISLKTLVELSLLLRTKDATQTCLLLALSDFNLKRLDVAASLRREKASSASIMQKSLLAKNKTDKLTETSHSVDENWMRNAAETSKKKKQAEFLSLKSKQYATQQHQLKKDLSASKADPSIYHSTLLNRSQELQDLKSRLLPLRAKLDSYHKLPPDVDLTKVQIEELKQQLKLLEEELAKHIDLLHA